MIITESIATEKHHKKAKKEADSSTAFAIHERRRSYRQKNKMKGIYSMSRLIILGGSRFLITGSLDFISAYVLIISGS